MKQVVLRGGETQVVDIPAPSPEPGFVLVANAASVISTGTERAGVQASSGGLVSRAIRNPELVVAALRHAREHGVRKTAEAARTAVGSDTALGYSTAGVVLDTGGIAELQPGQRVACAGAGRASHAEIVSVPGNLVARVPGGVELRDAAFTTLGAIAMQGVRRAEPTLGERFVVTGLGLLGLLTVQILRAAGVRVLGIEPQEERRRLAREFGAEDAFAPDQATLAVEKWTEGVGADAVVITAAAMSDEILNSAVEMLRRKGRVVPVGDVGMGIDRAPLYQREADVLISTSYGPGRYDPSYEELGLDYPIAYVRWTENRNMEEFLRLLATGQVQVEPLVELELPVDHAPDVYAQVKGERPPLAAVLTYEMPASISEGGAGEVLRLGKDTTPAVASAEVRVGLVGPGGFVMATHVPNLRDESTGSAARITFVCSRRGAHASDVARQLGGAQATTDWRALVASDEVDLVLVGTRHDTHAEIAAGALRAGKAVFCEKPLGLSFEEIDEVWEAGLENPRLVIGFNRPDAPLALRLESEVREAEGPLHVAYRVSAPLPADHWLNDPRQGGGRILGEACHMIDFANWLCGEPRRVMAAALTAPPTVESPESSSITVSYADGSVATVHYSGVGGSSMPKERVEVLRGRRSWVLDDFHTLTTYAPDGTRTIEEPGQDKGHAALLGRAVDACRGRGTFEPGLDRAYNAQAAALAALESIASGESHEVRLPEGAPVQPAAPSRP